MKRKDRIRRLERRIAQLEWVNTEFAEMLLHVVKETGVKLEDRPFFHYPDQIEPLIVKCPAQPTGGGE